MIGYLFAIVATVIVMLVYEHGQPALLYLVPGVCLSVIITSLFKGEFNLMWTHDENVFIGVKTEEEEKNEKEQEAK
jgi:minor histocompatibility antigen H13